VHDSATLSGVDLLAGEHRITPLCHATIIRQPQQEP
jgi:hypothetical protein